MSSSAQESAVRHRYAAPEVVAMTSPSQRVSVVDCVDTCGLCTSSLASAIAARGAYRGDGGPLWVARWGGACASGCVPRHRERGAALRACERVVSPSGVVGAVADGDPRGTDDSCVFQQ